jgi:pimeloyl-ACP methyl ester carboxylesterase
MLSSLLRTLRWSGALLLGVFLSPLVILFTCCARRSTRARSPSEAPPLYTDARWGEHVTYDLGRDGVKLHCVESGPATAPILLCVHGFPENWFSWRQWLRAFSATHRVVAVDLRGFGESPEPRASWCGSRRAAAREHVADLADLADVLVRKRSALLRGAGGAGGAAAEKCVTVAAHDWGGVLAWLLVPILAARGQLSHFIVMDAPHPAVYSKAASVAQLLKSLYIVHFQVPLLPEWYLSRDDFAAIGSMFLGKRVGVKKGGKFVLSPADVDVFKWALKRPGALTAQLNLYRQVFDLTHEDFRTLAAGVGGTPPLDAPTLIVWGSEDAALGPELARGHEFFAKDVRVEVIDGASHWVQQDATVDVIQHAARFLNVKADVQRLL